MRTWLGASLLALSSLGACQVAPRIEASPPPVSPPSKPLPVAPRSTLQVSIERMSEMTRILASDAFAGRSMGTAGEDRTVDYFISGNSQKTAMADMTALDESGIAVRGCSASPCRMIFDYAALVLNRPGRGITVMGARSSFQ